MLNIYLNRGYTHAELGLNLRHISSTTNCSVNVSMVYTIGDSAVVKVLSAKTAAAAQSKITLSVDLVISTVTLFSPLLANYLISFLQSNQLFLFLWLTRVPVGGIFELVNVNLYGSLPHTPTDLFTAPWRHYELLSYAENHQTYRIFTIADLLTFLVLCFICDAVERSAVWMLDSKDPPQRKKKRGFFG